LYKLFLTLRYLRKRQIVYIAIGAVMLCTAMVLVVMSVMGGWLDMVKQHARGLLGDVVIDCSNSGMPLYQEFIDEVSKWPEVQKATPIIYTYGLLRSPRSGITWTLQIVGVRFDEITQVNAFKQSLFYERFYPGTTNLGEQRRPLIGLEREIVIGSDSDPHINATVRLPEPFQSALERERERVLRETGKPLDDKTSNDTDLNAILRENGKPIVPGEWAYDASVDGPTYDEDPLPGVIIGRDMLHRREEDGRYTLNVPKGAKYILTFITMNDSANLDPPVKAAFRMVDDSRTGIYEIDSRSAYVDFDRLQRLVKLGQAERADGSGIIHARCSQIQVKLRPGVDAALVAKKLEERYHEFLNDPAISLTTIERALVTSAQAQTWQKSQERIIGPVEKERGMMIIILGMISLVAVALEMCILYMIVLQKTRDIGIVKAVGGSSTGVAAVWMFYGAAVGFVGGTLGLALGTVFVRNINEVQDFLIRINPALRVWNQQVYSFDRIPSVVDPWDATAVFAIAILASAIGSLAAALRAGYSEPVKALGYE